MAFLFQDDVPPVTPGGVQDVPREPNPGVSPVEQTDGLPTFLFQEEEDANDTVRRVIDQDPAANAQNRALSNEFGVSQDVVSEDPDTFKREQRINNVTNDLADAPVTATFLSEQSNAEIAIDDTSNLSAMERLGRAFDRGELLHQLGQAGIRLRAQSSPEALAAVEGLKQRLQDLGHDPEGDFVNWLAAASEVLGQQSEALLNLDALSRVGVGAGAGAAVGAAGLAGGPLAGITIPAGTVGGAASGLIGHLAFDAFQVEGGLNYIEMLDEGIDPEVAGPISVAVGVINAGLEVASETVILKPLSEAGKAIFKDGVKKAVRSKGFKELAGEFAKQYGSAVVAEVSTEVMQESVNIMAEELGKEFSEGEFEELTADQVAERLSGIAEQTFKAMTVLAAPGPTVNLAVQSKEAIRANKNKETLDQMHQNLQESEVLKRDPSVAAEHTAAVMREEGVENVYVPATRLTEWIFQQENPEALIRDLGVDSSLEQDLALGGLVEIDGRAFAEQILANPNYPAISEFIVVNQDGMNAAEAQEFAQSGLREEIQALPDLETAFETVTQEPDTQKRQEVNDPVNVAEFELGLGAMFRTANEAGMTDAQYAQYLQSVRKAHETAIRNRQDQVLAQEQRELTREWNSVFDAERETARENVSQQQVYQTIDSVGPVRMDRSQTQELVEAAGANLEDLPTQDRNRKLYTTTKSEASMPPDTVAELNGYESAEDMVLDLLVAPDRQTVIDAQATEATKAILGDTLERRQSIIDARQALHTDEGASVLVAELNALRAIAGAGRSRVSQKLLRTAARDQMQALKVRDISPNRFLANERRLARESARLLRRGDQAGAAQFKFQQALNYQMAKEAYQATKRIESQRKFMNKFSDTRKTFNISADALAAIRQLLERTQFKPGRTRRTDAVQKVANQSKDPTKIPDQILNDDSPISYKDMTLQEFTDLHDTVKELDKKARDAEKFRLETEKAAVQEKVDQVVENIAQNMPDLGDLAREKSNWASLRRFGDELVTQLFTVNTIVREVDGFQDNGAAFQSLQAPYERAIGRGYREDQKGWVARSQEEAKAQTDLFKVFSTKEQKRFNKKIKIPGVNRDVTVNKVLSVLLNSGNAQNMEALVAGGPYTEREIQLIHEWAPKKYWDFAQSVWNYLDKFYPEIAEAQKRRSDVPPQKVQAREVVTEHGTYKGGYYPIRYDSQRSFWDLKQDSKEMLEDMRKSNFLIQHTRRGHTEQRSKASPSNRVTLDVGVLNSHVNQVVYDLEVGDALADIAKVLYAEDTKAAFVDVGAEFKWDQLDLWFRDVTTNEIVQQNIVERGLRNLRSGVTVSSLGWNIGVILLQPLGIINAAVQLGKANVAAATRTVVLNSKDWMGEKSVFKMIDELSPFMRGRSETFDKDILDASTRFRKTWFDKVTPGMSADMVRSSMFYGIRKTQRLADAIVWLAAYRKGLDQDGMSQEDAIIFADTSVSRTQGSGVFGQRTKFERGSINKAIRQTEFIRIWTTFLGFFAAKFNVVAERTKKTNFKSIPSILNWAFDMVLLYTFEAIMVGLIRGEWPEEGDDETFISYAAGESVNTFMASIPILREASSAIQGFAPGGTAGRLADTGANAWEQGRQFLSTLDPDELDRQLFKSFNTLGGIWFKYPSSQINKSAEAILQAQEGEDISPMEFVMGPHYDR